MDDGPHLKEPRHLQLRLEPLLELLLVLELVAERGGEHGREKLERRGVGSSRRQKHRCAVMEHSNADSRGRLSVHTDSSPQTG